jgi:hypothetical protein
MNRRRLFRDHGLDFREQSSPVSILDHGPESRSRLSCGAQAQHEILCLTAQGQRKILTTVYVLPVPGPPEMAVKLITVARLQPASQSPVSPGRASPFRLQPAFFRSSITVSPFQE